MDSDFTDESWHLLPFVNAMHERYDFTWEREWRVLGDLTFQPSDIVCVILPETGAEDLRAELIKSGVAAVSPSWNYERIVQELALQQRKTKLHFKDLIRKSNASDKGEIK